jgi:hypothetical protein
MLTITMSSAILVLNLMTQLTKSSFFIVYLAFIADHLRSLCFSYFAKGLISGIFSFASVPIICPVYVVAILPHTNLVLYKNVCNFLFRDRVRHVMRAEHAIAHHRLEKYIGGGRNQLE